MERYQIIKHKDSKTYYLIDGLSGACILETENPETARRQKADLEALREFDF